MRTPRHSSRPGSSPGRGFGTLIGNGWLRESPRNSIPREWNVKHRSALRKCMFMDMPADIRALAAQLPAPEPMPTARRNPRRGDTPAIVRQAHDPKKDARLMPVVDPRAIRMKAHAKGERAWWEDPIALGSLLIVMPPIGLACVWRSKHYSNDARWALTVMTALITCFLGAIALAALFVR